MIDKLGGFFYELIEIMVYILSGMFLVNSENELIYIDNKWNINKFFNDLLKIIIFIVRIEILIYLMLLYCFSLIGDVFVGMWIFDFIKEKGLLKLFI